MNCKPGDLAIIVRSRYGNAGKVVKVVSLLHGRGLRNHDGFEPGYAWHIEPKLPTWGGDWTDQALDHNLRPIRDNDKEDETLTWAGKPAKEIA